MDISKQISLILYLMDSSDRHWLLKRVPEAMRFQVEVNLEELDHLAVPREYVVENYAHLLPEHLGQTLTLKTLCSIVDGLAPDRLKQVFGRESMLIVNAIVHYYDWSWKQTIIDQLKLINRIDTSSTRPQPNVVIMMFTHLLEQYQADAQQDSTANNLHRDYIKTALG
ncbi:MAG: hypothetical protein OEZ58_07940 [Gammaproteobacteria bacterium]|nr:hypothetical protein [Gammaproteobacteria bacterium]MDH5728907.1 hypothetical protein [Gammaproteobacteria bacterium]